LIIYSRKKRKREKEEKKGLKKRRKRGDFIGEKGGKRGFSERRGYS